MVAYLGKYVMYTQISNPMDYQVALYIRLSKEDDNEKESESVTNQRSLLGDFAKQHSLDVFDTYVDDGWSGTSFERPDFLRMIGDIEAQKVNMVITKDMSRLGRDYIQTGYYLERFFPEKRVRYISLLDGVDTGLDSSINDITPFKAIMNDMYAKDISKKITSVKRDKQKKGLFIGGKAPYGYKLSETQKNTIVIDEEAAAVVRRMFALALEGKSCREIACILNEYRIPTPAQYANLNVSVKGPYSGQWSAERVTFTLKNESYIGNMVQGRTRKINYKVKKCRKLPPEEWTVIENTHEPLVSRETFEKVQMLIESRKRTRSRTHDYLLKGIIHCAECGYPLGVIMRTLSGGRPTLYFVCRTYQRFTSYQKCTCHCIRVETVTEVVIDRVREICRQYLYREECEEIVEKAVNEANADNDREKELTRISVQIDMLTNQLDKMYVDKLSGLLDDGDFQRVYLKIKEERAKLLERVKKLEAIKTDEIIPSQRVDELIQKFLDTAECNKELIVSLIKRIELTEDKEVRIFFRFKQLEAMDRLQ